MSDEKKPRTARVAIDPALIDRAIAKLAALPAKEKPVAAKKLTVSDAVRLMKKQLKEALAKNYTTAEVATILSGEGIKVSPSTIKSVLSRQKKAAAAVPKADPQELGHC
jgi:hypothetical protein